MAGFFSRLKSIFSGHSAIDEDFYEELEETLIMGDMGITATEEVMEELRRQVRNMHEAGMGGFFMHARGGLETEYMGEDWFRAIEASMDEAKKLGMNAWCYDENGWPSGFAGGALLKNPENLVHFLRFANFSIWFRIFRRERVGRHMY